MFESKINNEFKKRLVENKELIASLEKRQTNIKSCVQKIEKGGRTDKQQIVKTLQKDIDKIELEKKKAADCATNYLLDNFELIKGFCEEKKDQKTDEKYYKDLVFGKKMKPPKPLYFCEQCGVGKVHIPKDGVLVCPKCAVVTELYIDPYSQNSQPNPYTNGKYSPAYSVDEKSNFPYRRSNHFREWLNQIQALERTNIPPLVFDLIKKECVKNRIRIPEDVTVEKILNILKRLKLQRFYENKVSIAKSLNPKIKPPRLDERVTELCFHMFDLIQEPFERHKKKNRRNFPSYPYILYKFMELLGLDDVKKSFTLLKSRAVLYDHDQTWKGICSDLGWEFIRTI